MLLGPVFNAELITTARRPRYYVVRFLYGLVILAQVYLTYQSNTWQFAGRQQFTTDEMAAFGKQIFDTFSVLQLVVVILLTPALVGGTIADERQRKTLHYLLTSRLSSAEIILSKLGARLLQAGVLVALGLPVVSLVGLFGGIDFQELLIRYAATFTTIYFLATASILVSVVSRRPREAISLIYMLAMVWLFVPTIFMSLIRYWPEPWPTIGLWVNPVIEYVAVTSPIYLMSPMGFSGAAWLPSIFWGMGLQVAYGTVFVILAAMRLRPSNRNEGGSRSSISRKFAAITRKRRWFARPECGDDAMFWKEMYVARTGGLTKAVMSVIGVCLVGIIGYSAYGFLEPAMNELWRDGYSTAGPGRRDLNIFIRLTGVGIYVLWLLGVASSSASGLSSEREEDQWTSLVTTPLSGEEILRAKMFGPIWGLRLVACMLFLSWGVGLAVGAVHPFGALACFIEFVVYTWFATALGTFFSLRSKNSTRALASTIGLMIFLNGAYMFCCIPMQPNTPAIAAGSTPFVFGMSLMYVEDLDRLWTDRHYGEMLAASVMSVLFYGMAAAGLTASLFSSFDAIVDRPDRFRQGRTLNQQREFLQGRSKEIRYPDTLD